MITIAIATQKGGVGKTTTVVNLADMLAHDHNCGVLIIDADPQASLTKMCDVDVNATGLYEALTDEPYQTHQIRDGVTLLSSVKNLVDIERTLEQPDALSRIISYGNITDGIDFVLIDCPPALSMLTTNALYAADYVLIPSRPHVDDAEGVHEFMETVEHVQEQNGGNPHVIGVLLNEFDGRLREHRTTLGDLADQFNVLDAKIGKTVRIAEASRKQSTLRLVDSGNKQLLNYRALAQEVLSYVS